MDKFLKKKKENIPAQRQFDVNQLLSQTESELRPSNANADAKNAKKADDQWLDDNDEIQESQNQTGQSDKNQRNRQKKKVVNQMADWSSAAQDKEPVTLEEQPQAEAPTKGVMRKPGELLSSQTIAKFDDLEEEFPDLGATDVPKKQKPKPKPQSQQQEFPSSGLPSAGGDGPRRFQNSKKVAGETFKPLDAVAEPEVVEAEASKPVAEVTRSFSRNTETVKPPTATVTATESTEGTRSFSRNTETVKPTESVSTTETPALSSQHSSEYSRPRDDTSGLTRSGLVRSEMTKQSPAKVDADSNAESKFKFGGEGPKRFTGVKKEVPLASQPKTEAELRREEAERRAEENLQKEKERLAPADRPKLGFANKHAVDNTVKTNGTVAPANVDPEGFQSVEYKLQKKEKKPRENGDKPYSDKPYSDKPREYSDKPRTERPENGDKPKFRKEISSEQPKEQVTRQQDAKPAEVHEPKKVTAQVKMAGWGEGGIIKKKAI